MKRLVKVAATQMACSWDKDSNVQRASELIKEAAAKGAQIILIQELFETPYFCIEQNADFYALATTLEENTTIKKMAELAKALSVVIPVSWFEKSGKAFFNSVAVIDADGSILGIYRKTHIPNEVGYQEKQYFTPGDTGFKVWKTRYGSIGVGICWDQWFPETARCMALMGAELLFYPTAIGSELNLDFDSMPHWQTVMRGHAAANLMPVIASNRIGEETSSDGEDTLTFYGSSFICDQTGALVQKANRTDQSVLVHEFDLQEIEYFRNRWCLFRDRRPEHYAAIMTHDGNTTRHK